MSEDPMAELRAELERWNAQLRDWEASLASTQSELLPVYEEDLAQWRAQLERAAGRLRQLQASSDAGADHARDVEASLEETAQTFQRLRARFSGQTPS